MSMYIFITEEDRISKRQVQDPEVQEMFNEALEHDSSLMIEQNFRIVKKGWFRSEETTSFSIYHESPAHDGSPYQARYQIIGSGTKEGAMAYLCGIINGALSAKK